MRKNIVSGIIMIASISAILIGTVSSAKASESELETQSFEGFKDEIPGCNAPFTFTAMPADGIIALRNNDVALSVEQNKAMRYFVEEFGSAVVCQADGALVITGQL
jgi:hypothetical protein